MNNDGRPPHQSQPNEVETNECVTTNMNSEQGDGGSCSDEVPTTHPYQAQLSSFKPNPWQLEHMEPIPYKRMEDTELVFVNTTCLFDNMLLQLNHTREFAVDLEHHSYRSFKGIVCIVQISTRERDYVIDSIALKEEMHRMNEVCTDTSIVKVVHGGERDVEWLHKHFSVFIVNMFDTQKAGRILQEESVSCAHLLQKYCNVSVNKRFQLADWRVRPIPHEMLVYARQDSHYLLYLYDVYRNALRVCTHYEKPCTHVCKNLLQVYTMSTHICYSVYSDLTNREWSPDSYMACYRKIKGRLNVQQIECFRLLYDWRHKMSEERDESPGYTLPNRMMFEISLQLPRDVQSLVNCCIPPPPLVMENIHHIHTLVLKAIENVPTVPEDDQHESLETNTQSPNKVPKKVRDKERLVAIDMINKLFLLQLKLRPELRLLPEAAPLLKFERENSRVR